MKHQEGFLREQADRGGGHSDIKRLNRYSKR